MEREPATKTIDFEIKGLDCPDCALSLEKAVQGLPGVASAQLVFAASKLTVTPEAGAEIVPEVQRVAESMGHEAIVEGQVAEPARRDWRAWVHAHRRTLSTLGGGLLLLLGFGAQVLGGPLLLVRLLYGASIVVGGVYVAKAGWVALRTARSLDMNTLMTIAVVGAMFIGDFAEGAVTILLFSIGELLENYSMDRARNAIRTLMGLAPAQATVLREGQEQRVNVADIRVGDRVLVRPGERVPMDGRVLEGRSAIDQAPITGESIPVEKGPGNETYAGTINGNGALVIEVTHLAEDNTIARITRLVAEAQAQRAPSQRFVDRFARVYTPIVIAVAAGVAVIPPLVGLGGLSEWLYRALVLLVIACPCALVISTPVTIVSALTRAARAGVLIKGGRHLEELATLRVIAFDKTGTLTQGKPQVVGGGCALSSDAPKECLACQDLVAKAAAVEGRSEHALGKAVVDYARLLGLEERYAPGENVTAVTGMGIEGLVGEHAISVGSHAFCHRNGGAEDALCEAVTEAERKGHTVLVIEDACCGQRCYLEVADTLREGVPDVVRELKSAGIEHTVMLTGDNAFIAQSTAEKAAIDEVRAGLLPEGKVQAMQALRERYGQVAMVGDGVNDAPAMVKANVGIAMGAAGTATALETADIALMGDDLSRLPFAIRLSRHTLRTVRTNIALSLLIKVVFLALAIGGISTLWMAVLADTGASLLVTLNGLRMLGFRGTRA